MSHDGNALHMSQGVQLAIAAFVLFTGALPQAFQALIHGFSGTVHSVFVLFLASAIAIDLLRLLPMFVLRHHPMGILHPLVLVALIWPVIVELPLLIQGLFGYAGLLAGSPVSAPTYRALGWLPAAEVWLAMAKYNGVQIIGMASFYAGYGFSSAKSGKPIDSLKSISSEKLRNMMILFIAITFVSIAVFIYYRGGLLAHLDDLAGGRFRALAGLGPLLALFDLSLWACVIWIAARPGDAAKPLFIFALLTASVSQFLINGSRAGTIFVIVLVVLAWSLRKQRLPWRLAVLILPVAFLSFGFLNIVRSAAWTGDNAAQAVQSVNLDKIIQNTEEEFEIRRSISGSVPVVEDGMRVSDGPLWGYSYLGGVFAFIPRSVWQTKPRGPGSIYAVAFLGEEVEGTAVPIGPYSEAYWNFHIPGVIILFLLYGFLLRRVSELYLANSKSPFIVAFFVMFATQFGISTDNLVSFQQALMVLTILFGTTLAVNAASGRERAGNDSRIRSSRIIRPRQTPV